MRDHDGATSKETSDGESRDVEVGRGTKWEKMDEKEKGEGEGDGDDEPAIKLSPRDMGFVFLACLLAMLLFALDQTIGMFFTSSLFSHKTAVLISIFD